MKWKCHDGGDYYTSGEYFIKKIHGWRPNHPRRNWIWEPHGPGVPVLAATLTLREAKAMCEEKSERR